MPTQLMVKITSKHKVFFAQHVTHSAQGHATLPRTQSLALGLSGLSSQQAVGLGLNW